VDFVCFGEASAKDAVKGLEPGRTKHYIFISSDSVYMACEPHGRDAASPWREEDARRPAEEKHRKRLKRHNPYQYGYGANKLSCEEVLAEAYRKSGFPYTALRLPDVIGPYDNLGGFLRVQQLMMQGGWILRTTNTWLCTTTTHVAMSLRCT